MRPEFSDAHLNLAGAFDGLHQASEAEKEFLAAIDSSPLDYDAHNRLAAFYQKAGRIEEAQKQYLVSFAAQPNAAALDGLGDIAVAEGQTATAERYFRQGVDIDEYDHHAHYELVRFTEKAAAMRKPCGNLTLDNEPMLALTPRQRLRRPSWIN